jgi:hypothetical protein
MKDIYYKELEFNATDGTDQEFTFSKLQSYNTIEFTLSWTGLNAVDGNVKIQEGTGDIYVDIIDADVNLDAVSDVGIIKVDDFSNTKIKVVVDFGKATAGIITAMLVAKA